MNVNQIIFLSIIHILSLAMVTASCTSKVNCNYSGSASLSYQPGQRSAESLWGRAGLVPQSAVLMSSFRFNVNLRNSYTYNSQNSKTDILRGRYCRGWHRHVAASDCKICE